ncbi:Sterol desaturase [Labilithrix luteola]|uniref:Sterol desaturase n=1 Tax=Labilithrix luteola TaxID=1391654 RepID=A0A0K1Q808_9BACT|nr:sterol desaturase family protein [Labilithrix luteola]AKV01545.1 Sterol desaturase [Labilithrix luteola]
MPTPTLEVLSSPSAASVKTAESAADAVRTGEAGVQASDETVVVDARVGRLTEARRERVRQRALAEIPWWYSPWGHLAGTTGIGVGVLALSAYELHAISGFVWTDLFAVLVACLVANFFEWRVHKGILHKRTWPWEIIYDKHTPMHHMIYVEEDMALRSTAEFRLVLIPAAGVLGIVLAATPFAVGIGKLWSASAGWLFLVATSLFMVSYELLHLSYHAPKTSIVNRLAILRILRAHHAKHHDPRLMQRWNFNVTVPLFDWIMGTIAPRDAPRS